MKAAIVLAVSIAVSAAMGAAADTKPAPATSPAVVKPSEIPANAAEIAPGLYRFTDAAGVGWLLRRTPFGVAAVQEKSADWAQAVEYGDKIRFVAVTPFGPYTWERRKAELNLAERDLCERQRDRAEAK
jgi:hypothetical protein